MEASRVVLALLSSLLVCSAQHYSRSDACRNDRTCEYVHSLEMDQFTVNEVQPMTLTATVEINCESGGFYGSEKATRYCMTVTEIGGNFPSFGRDPTDNNNDLDMSATYGQVVEYLSGWFCFVQTSQGQVVSVFHARDENADAVNFKKGIAAAFQANFRGTSKETEIDPNSKHTSHYSYVPSEEGSVKMHRSVTSADIMEYAMDVPARHVELVEEEDIEYKGGQLIRSNGTIHMSFRMDRQEETVSIDNLDQQFSDVLTARGSFNMELKLCRFVPRTARRRRNAVRQSLNSDFSSEETLLASYDKEKHDRETLNDLHLQLQTRNDIIVAIQNANSSKIYRKLEQIMILEYKYGAQDTYVRDYIIDYLDEVIIEESVGYELQRITIYSLLSVESSLQAQQVLMRQLKQFDMSDMERSSLTLAIASIQHPSHELIEELEDMITENSETSPLLLAYGALVANVAADRELEMVTFLIDQLPDNSLNSQVLIHVLHALSNTQSRIALQYIMTYTQHSDETVVLTAVTALRLFTALPSVQQQLIYTLRNSTHSVSLVSAVIDSLRDGYALDQEMIINAELIGILVNVTISFGNTALQNEVVDFFRSVELLDYANNMINTARERARRQSSSTSDWDSSSSQYNVVSPEDERAQDVSDFPHHRGFLWSHCVGKTSGQYRFYLQAAAGAFAGYSDDYDFKVKEKAVVRAHVLGHEGELVNILGSVVDLNGNMSKRLYVKYGGNIVQDISETVLTSFVLNHPLPQYRSTLFQFDYPLTIGTILLNLHVGVTVGVGGSVQISGSVSKTRRGTAALIPSAYASVDATVSASVLVARAGLTLTGATSYDLGAELSVTTSPDRPAMALTVYHEWPGATVTLSAFYEHSIWLWYGWETSRRSYDIFTADVVSSGGRRILQKYT